MSSEWSTGKLGDFIELKRGYDLPQAKRASGHIPLVSSSGITDKHNVAMVKGPGVVTGRYGPIGQVFYVEDDYWPLNTTLYVKDFKGNHPKFIHYFLKTVDFFAYSDKAAVPGVNRNHLHEAVAHLAPPAAQMEIAEMLGALDDRITLLREANATLEAIAQALFKSWFVDFDPVRAKMEGRAPEGMDEATAALFPDSFEETELGLVPEGWRVGTLSDLMRLHKGSVNPGLQPETEFQHFSLPAFDNGQLPVLELGSAIKSNKTTVPSDGVLLSKLNPHIPRIWLPSQVLANAVCSTEFLPFIPTKETATSFVYCLLAAPSFSTSLCQLVTGTSNSHQRIKPDGVLSMPNILPPPALIAAFDFVACALLNRVRANRQKAQTLSTLRDTLLPRLISGQLRVTETPTTVEKNFT